MSTLKADTTAVASSSDGDATYHAWEGQLNACLSARDALVPQIRTAIDGAQSGTAPLDEGTARRLTAHAWSLVAEAHTLGHASAPPRHILCH